MLMTCDQMCLQCMYRRILHPRLYRAVPSTLFIKEHFPTIPVRRTRTGADAGRHVRFLSRACRHNHCLYAIHRWTVLSPQAAGPGFGEESVEWPVPDEASAVGAELWNFGPAVVAGACVCHYAGFEDCLWEAEAGFD